MHKYILIILERKYNVYINEHCKRKLMRNERLWRELTDYKERSKSGGTSYSDYWLLYRYIKDVQPKEVLECGTGVSTIVMAYAMLENEEENGKAGRITSMEESEKYYREAYRLLPKHLSQFVDIVHSPKQEGFHFLFRGVRYERVPKRPYEFVFIDGPTTKSVSDNQKTFDFDLIDVIKNSEHPVFAMVDTRFSTCWVFQNVLVDGKVRYHYGYDVGFIGPATKDDLVGTNSMMRKIGPHAVKRCSLLKGVSFGK